jgi:hypothetical protein
MSPQPRKDALNLAHSKTRSPAENTPIAQDNKMDQDRGCIKLDHRESMRLIMDVAEL